MTHITLPRAVVEQALEALESVYGDSCDALHALRAALAQQAEPVQESSAYSKDWCLRMAQIEMDAGAEFEIGPDLAQQVEPVEPVAHLWQQNETGRTRVVTPDQGITADGGWRMVGPLYLVPPQQAEPVAWEGWWLHHGQHNYRAKPLTSERVKELMKLAFEVGREATLPQQAEPVQALNAWAADRLARHGIQACLYPNCVGGQAGTVCHKHCPTPCPDCRGLGYDASGQLCGCQGNPSF